MLDGASKATLENEFGTTNDDECIIKILEKGEVQQSQVGGDMISDVDIEDANRFGS